MKKHLILYRISTGLLSLMMLGTVANSIFNDHFSERFMSLGYPQYLILPLMLAKVLGVITLWTNISNRLSEFAYSGFFFLVLLAFISEFHAKSPDLISPCIAMIFLSSSFYFRLGLARVRGE